MNRLFHALSDMLIARSRRERWLLGLLVLVMVPFAYVYGVVLPLNVRHGEAQAALEEAMALERWLQARRVELEGLPPVPDNGAGAQGAAAGRPLPGLGGIETRLDEAGLPAAGRQLASTEAGGVELRMKEVAFSDLMTWLDALEAETGYRLTRMTLLRGPRSGVVEADILLQPQ